MKASPNRSSAPAADLRAKAERRLRQTRRKVGRIPPEDAQKLVHELQVHQIELEMQNDELRRAQLELEQARDRYANLYDFAPVGYLTLDAGGVIQHANLAAARLLGVNREKLIAAKLTAFITAESQDAFYLHRQQVANGRVKQTCELQFRRQDGSTFFGGMESILAPGESGKRCRWLAAFDDQTDRKRAEEALLDSHRFNQQVIASAKDGIIVYSRELKYVVWNPFMEELTGVPAGEVIGKHPLEVFPFLRAAGLIPHLNQALAGTTGTPLDFHYLVPQTGRSGWVSDINAPLRNARGKIIGVIGIVRDITDRKQREEALRASEERYRVLFASSRDAIMTLEPPSWKFTSGNPATVKIFRAGNVNRFVTTAPWDLSPEFQPDGRPSIKAAKAMIDAAMRQGTQLFEWRQKRLDGEEFPASVLLARVELEGRAFLQATVRDITERKQAEDALRRSERNLSIFFSQAPIGLEWLSASGAILRANQAQLDQLGYSREEYLGHFFGEFCVAPISARWLLEQLAAKGTIRNLRMLRRCKDGTVRIMLLDATPLWNEGQFLYSSVFSRDITERVKLEREILEVSEREQRRIAQDLHDGLGQLLVGTAYLGSTLRQKLAARQAPEVQQLDRLLRVLNGAIEQTRSLARGLHPIKPEPNGLMVALKDLASQTTNWFRVACRFACRQPVLIAESATATHLYRIAQEAVTNAIKHGNPGRIQITLTRTPGRLNLMVKDDGVGLPANLRRKRGMGLRIMRYRAGVIGGSLAIRKEAGGGTAVVCSVHESADGLACHPEDATEGKD
jgi:PAS domain S-box-containing protein